MSHKNEPTIVKIYILEWQFRKQPILRLIPSQKRIPFEQAPRKTLYIVEETRGKERSVIPSWHTAGTLALQSSFIVQTPEISSGSFFVPPYDYKFSWSGNNLQVSIEYMSPYYVDVDPQEKVRATYSYTVEPTLSNKFVLVLGFNQGGYGGYLPIVRIIPYEDKMYQQYQLYETLLKDPENILQSEGKLMLRNISE